MARARTGAGAQFNLGEVTVTRCSIRLENGTIGHGYVRGRDKKQAEFVAVFDALLQDDSWRARLNETVIAQISEKLQQKKDSRAAKVAATKLIFTQCLVWQ